MSCPIKNWSTKEEKNYPTAWDAFKDASDWNQKDDNRFKKEGDLWDYFDERIKDKKMSSSGWFLFLNLSALKDIFKEDRYRHCESCEVSIKKRVESIQKDGLPYL